MSTSTDYQDRQKEFTELRAEMLRRLIDVRNGSPWAVDGSPWMQDMLQLERVLENQISDQMIRDFSIPGNGNPPLPPEPPPQPSADRRTNRE